jgi:hypothetical protein
MRGLSRDFPGRKFVARNFAAIVVPECVYLPGDDGTLYGDPDLGQHEGLSAKSAAKLMRSVIRENLSEIYIPPIDMYSGMYPGVPFDPTRFHG